MKYTVLAAGLAAAIIAPGAVAARSGGFDVELNKLEETESGGCRAYFLFRNRTSDTYEAFSLSVATLDTSGVIDRLLSIDAAPLPAQRTTLKLFEIPGTRCEDISEILVHEIDACRPQNGAETDCFPMIDFGSKSPVSLVK